MPFPISFPNYLHPYEATPVVGGPVFSFRIIRLADLPAARRIVDPPLESPQLLFLADVQEKFHDVRAVRDEPPLEVVNFLVALRSNHFGNEIVDTHDKHVLVV
jgi:hypothetical protein